MQCMISWGKMVGTDPVSPSQHDALERVLMGRPWFRAFPGTAVVQVTDDGDRIALITKFSAVILKDGKTNPSFLGVYVLVSPVMPATLGRYNGLLPPEYWDQLNAIGK